MYTNSNPFLSISNNICHKSFHSLFKVFRRSIFFLILLIPLASVSQGEWNNWVFGKHSGITFNTIPPTPISNVSPLYNSRGANVSVSDSLGNLIFYTEVNIDRSQWIYNRSHNRTPNGNLFSGSDANQPQSFFAVQSLTDDSSYYIFSVIDPYDTLGFGGLVYSVFDIRLDNGFGDIVPGKKSLPIYLGGDAHSVITGTRHHNNKDAWIIVRKLNTPHYRSYLINSLGIDTIPVTSNSLITTNPNISNYLSVDNIKISPDGTKLICLADSSAEYCTFNSTTGVISPLFKIFVKSNQNFWYDYTEFSVDNKFLYITEGGQGSGGSRLYQFDATLTDSTQFKQSQVLISSENFLWNQYFSGLQRGPDHKIYVSAKNANIDSISVINNPSVQGTGCNFQKNALWLLSGNFAWRGFPQFLQKYSLYMNHYGQCETDSISFSFISWPPTDSLYWNFGDPASGSSNISHLIHPKHKFSVAGSYNVTLIVRYEDKRFDTVIQSLSIKPSPTPMLGSDQTICSGDSVTFDAGACSGCTYEWKDLATGLVIGTNQTFTTGIAGAYFVKVTNGNGCSGFDTVQVVTTPAPQLTNNPLYDTICSGETTNIPLTSNPTGATFHWTATLTSGAITGFSADSGLVIDQTLVNTGSTAGIVTYHITPKIGDCSGSTVDFPVTVIVGDSVKVLITASLNNICAGTPVTFTATPTNPGTTPVYQWKVNSLNAGNNSPTFVYSPSNGDVVQCILTSSNTVCTSNNPASSNTISMVVFPILPVSVTVSPSQNPVCAGTSVAFTATPTNGGATPSYQWKVNGINVGTNNPSFSYIPINNDIVTCILTSSETCSTGNPASSNIVTMTVNPLLPVSISIIPSSNPFCIGNSVTFTATPTNGGTTPAYQWKVNGVNVGTNAPTYTFNPLNNDSVRCVMTSNLICVSNNPASSNKIILSGTLAPVVTFTSCFDTITTLNAKPIKLKGGIPLNGTYSGPGVNSLTGMFTPSAAGVGTKTITYTYTNAGLCSASKTRTILVQSTPAFTCGNNLTDIRDSKVYPTVQIGSQCWMAADLNFGNEIPPTIHQRDNCVSEKYFNPASSIQHPASVYQWDEIMRYDDVPSQQGFCPPGWHIPTEVEWNTLFANWINNAFAGAPLKYSGYSGFNAFLSGARHETVKWDYQGFATFFWSSTSYGSYKAWAHGMNDFDPSVSLYPSLRSNAFSVRCLKD